MNQREEFEKEFLPEDGSIAWDGEDYVANEDNGSNNNDLRAWDINMAWRGYQAALKTTPELWEECGECGGKGFVHTICPTCQNDPAKYECPECHEIGEWDEPCHNSLCHNGKVPKYWTPERMKAAGFEVLDTDSVWVLIDDSKCGSWYPDYKWIKQDYGTLENRESLIIVVAFQGQPKPPEDWSP